MTFFSQLEMEALVRKLLRINEARYMSDAFASSLPRHANSAFNRTGSFAPMRSSSVRKSGSFRRGEVRSAG